jgi:predicted nuclease of restriction endonuclease-like RecB superfamily
MLTGKMVRVRHAKNRLIPLYINAGDPHWQDVAARLLDLYRSFQGCTRGELEEEITEALGDNPTQLVHQGLAKLLEDRCEFEVDASHPPEELREKTFRLSAAKRTGGTFDRAAVLADVAAELGMAPEVIERGLFADLKLEQRLIRFHDCTVEQLLDRYNVALAQAVLLRSTGVKARVSGETPARYRQLFRAVKFHRLICEIRGAGSNAYELHLDGPLSLFSSTQKYGLQLALFLPTILQCKNFSLTAQVRWGAQRKEKEFALDSGQGLRPHLPDYGDYVPKDLALFAEMFRKQVTGWDLDEGAAVVPVGNHFWAPDFVLVHRKTSKRVYLEILGFWRRSGVEEHVRRLRAGLREPFVLAVSEQFNIDEALGDGDEACVYRFKRTPLPEDVLRLAAAQL